MKKLFGILICLTLLVIAVAPTATAAEAASASKTNIYLINPVALVTLDDHLFVADNVGDTESVVLCFDVSTDTPEYIHTNHFNEKIVNLSSSNGKLYAIFSQKVVELEVSSSGKFALRTTKTFAIENVVDFALGKYPMKLDDCEWALTAAALNYYFEGSQFVPYGGFNSLSQTKACVALNNHVYFLHNSSNRMVVTDVNCKNLEALTLNLGDYTFYGMTTNGEELVLFDNGKIFATNNFALFRESTEIIVSAEKIVDVATSANRYYVLNDKNKVDVYLFNGASYVKSNDTIGSETVDLGVVPTSYDGFTLVKSKGYPTNIVYKTTDSKTSVPEIIKNNDEQIIVLHFDGADSLPYYYVLIGEKYGWVKKSDGAKLPDEDDKLAKIYNKVSDDITYNAKFNSLNGVFVHSLPLTNSKTWSIEQSATNLINVTVLQKFTETINGVEKTWYYVSYKYSDETQSGFVESSQISHFHGVMASGYVKVLDNKKINASLFQAVSMYATEDMQEGETVCDDNGKVIKLYSGDRVKVLKETGEGDKAISFIEVTKNNGTTNYGWVHSNNLVGLHRITTNAIVGLVILIAAIVLTILFIMLFWKRKEHKKNNKD